MEKKETIKTSTKKQSKKKLSVAIFDAKGKETGGMELPDSIFAISASPKLLALYVRVFLNNQKFNVATTKSRGEVRGSTRKIYRQKGTGRARHGDIKAPIFVGGGIAHGPRGVKRKLTMNKKQKVKALKVALTESFKRQAFVGVLDTQGIDGKTKQMVSTINTIIPDNRNLLLVYMGMEEDVVRQAISNLSTLHVAQAQSLNAYQVLRAKRILFTKIALTSFLKRGSLQTK